MKDRERRSKRYSIALLRADLSKAVRRAEAGETVEITRRGKPVAVLLGRDDYELLSRGGTFWERYERFRESRDLAALDIEPEEVFGATRDRSPGRETAW